MERGSGKRRERMAQQQYAVIIGLGAFGASMFENLRKMEHEVLGIAVG